MSTVLKILLIVAVVLYLVIKYWHTIIEIITVLRKITIRKIRLYVRRHWRAITLTAVMSALAIVALIVLCPGNSNELVYVTETGSKYHTPDCPHLSASKTPKKLGDAAKKYQPCGTCKPPALQECVSSMVNYLFEKTQQLISL